MREFLPLGTLLGDRYRILSIIGEGGMGTVYKAEDLKLNGKLWAIKQTYRFPEENDFCLNEAAVLMQLKHAALPNIVDFFATEMNEYSYLVMDLIEGDTLEALFRKANQGLEYTRIVDLAVQLCEVLEYLHQSKSEAIIYRDIKPSNVMVDANDRITLIDFGIARSFKAGQSQDTVPIGTIGFAAPEQYDQKQTDERTDLYSLGAMLYYLLSHGKYYYISQQPLDVMEAALPKQLCAMVDCLLQTNPDDRYQSAADLRKDILRFMDAEANKNSQSLKITRSLIPTIISRKIIIVYGLYSGSGATFTALSLARALHYGKIPHVLIEHPVNTPELKQLLGIEAVQDDVTMRKGYTRLVVFSSMNTQLNLPNVDQELEESIAAAVEPIIIIDASYGTLNDELFRRATHILCVANSAPSKLSEHAVEHLIEMLNTWRKRGVQVHCIANQDIPFSKRKAWLDALPIQPIAIMPHISYKQIVEALWNENPVVDDVTLNPIFLSCWKPFLNLILPGICKEDAKYSQGEGRLARMMNTIFKKRLH